MAAPGSPGASGSRIVVCPTCRGDSVYGPSNRFRPFCSERCKNVDLGAWAAEDYRMGAPTRDIDGDTLESNGD